MNALVEMLAIPVIRNAFIGMLVAGATLSTLGVVIVSLHLMALRFTLMHVGLLGAAAGMSLGFSATAGAFVLVPVASVLMGTLGQRFRISASSMTGFFMTGSLAGAFLLLARAGVPAMDVFGIFAGNILMLGRLDVVLVAVLGVAVVLAFVIGYREIQAVLLDRDLALSLGVPVQAVVAGLFLLLGAAVALALRLVGALLVDAIILLPGMAALRFARGFGSALVLSSVFGVIACAGGFFVAVRFNLPIGASSAAVSSAILGLSAVVTCRK